MKRYLIGLLLFVSLPIYGQVSGSLVVRVQDSTKIFGKSLPQGTILINAYGNKTYQILRSTAGTKKLSVLVIGTDYMDLSSVFDLNNATTWATSNNYVFGDITKYDYGNMVVHYFCQANHTSTGDYPDEHDSAKWRIIAFLRNPSYYLRDSSLAGVDSVDWNNEDVYGVTQHAIKEYVEAHALLWRDTITRITTPTQVQKSLNNYATSNTFGSMAMADVSQFLPVHGIADNSHLFQGKDTGYFAKKDTLVYFLLKKDTIYFLHQSDLQDLRDSINNLSGRILNYEQDSANLLHWHDTIAKIATKNDLDTLKFVRKTNLSATYNDDGVWMELLNDNGTKDSMFFMNGNNISVYRVSDHVIQIASTAPDSSGGGTNYGFFKKITIPKASLDVLHTTPFQLLPSPGPSRFIDIISAFTVMHLYNAATTNSYDYINYAPFTTAYGPHTIFKGKNVSSTNQWIIPFGGSSYTMVPETRKWTTYGYSDLESGEYGINNGIYYVAGSATGSYSGDSYIDVYLTYNVKDSASGSTINEQMLYDLSAVNSGDTAKIRLHGSNEINADVKLYGERGVEVSVVDSSTVKLSYSETDPVSAKDLGSSAYTNIDVFSTYNHSHANAIAGGADGFLTGADKTKLDNTSNTNSGDNAVNSLYSGLVTFPGFGTSHSTAAYGDHSHDFSGSFAAISHAHGNITNAGAIGSTTGLPVITGASGVLTVGSFGTGSGTFAAGNDSRFHDQNATNSLYSGLITNATHSGDASGATALTLATVNSNIGTYNNITINAKGLATAGTNVAYLTSFTEADPIHTAWLATDPVFNLQLLLGSAAYADLSSLVQGTGGTFTGDVIFNDTKKLAFGTSGIADSYIYWNDALYYTSSNYHTFMDMDSHPQFNTNATGVNIPIGKTYQIEGVPLRTFDWDNLISELNQRLGSAAYAKISDFAPANQNVQELTGTTPSLNVNNGIHARLTISGNTTITLSNLVAGMTGNIAIYNPSTAYTLSFSGYTNDINPNIYTSANLVTCSGGSKRDVFSWWYDGTYLHWNGTKGML